ncbi:MAG: sulfatase family protein [Thermoguttaceae bacterium]
MSKTIHVGMAIVWTVAALGLDAVSVAAEATRPNLVFILSDDHSAPFVGCYGNKDVKTPNLDRFASEGMRFDRFFTAAPQCVPSRAALMTGRSAVAARITRFSSPLARDEVVFPELLRSEAGYHTGVCGRSYHLDGSNRGGQELEALMAKHGLKTFTDRLDYVKTGSDNEVPAQVEEFLGQVPEGRPFFLWVNFSDPHHVWNAKDDEPDPATVSLPAHWPDLPGVREQVAAYCGEVTRLDRSFQAVIDVLRQQKVYDTSLVVFCGDNGQALPHGKGSLYDPGLNVPFIVRWPAIVKPGTDTRVLVSAEDLGPTMLDAAGVAVPERMSGASVLKLLRGEPFEARRFLFAERGPHGSSPVTVDMSNSSYDLSRCVRSDRYKFIYNCTPWIPYAPVDSAGGPGWQQMKEAAAAGTLAEPLRRTYFTTPRPVYELYDLQADPSELDNLSGRPELAAVEHELRLALIEKMMVDFDYLPLPALDGNASPKPARKMRGTGPAKR